MPTDTLEQYDALFTMFDWTSKYYRLGPRPVKPYTIVGGEYYAAPDATGSGDGTIGSPWTYDQAFSLTPQGSVVLFRGGKYLVSEKKRISRVRCHFESYPGELAVFDSSHMETHPSGVHSNAGVDTTSGSSNMTLRRMVFRGGTTNSFIVHDGFGGHLFQGLVIEDTRLSGFKLSNTSNNVVEDCWAINNSDTGIFQAPQDDGNNGDGFSVREPGSHNNTFINCAGTQNSDEAFDFYGSGPNNVAINCIGFLNGNPGDIGSGSAFKLGGISHTDDCYKNASLRCMAGEAGEFFGFYDNDCKFILIKDCTSADYPDYTYNEHPSCRIENSIAEDPNSTRDQGHFVNCSWTRGDNVAFIQNNDIDAEDHLVPVPGNDAEDIGWAVPTLTNYIHTPAGSTATITVDCTRANLRLYAAARTSGPYGLDDLSWMPSDVSLFRATSTSDYSASNDELELLTTASVDVCDQLTLNVTVNGVVDTLTVPVTKVADDYIDIRIRRTFNATTMWIDGAQSSSNAISGAHAAKLTHVAFNDPREAVNHCFYLQHCKLISTSVNAAEIASWE